GPVGVRRDRSNRDPAGAAAAHGGLSDRVRGRESRGPGPFVQACRVSRRSGESKKAQEPFRRPRHYSRSSFHLTGEDRPMTTARTVAEDRQTLLQRLTGARSSTDTL